MKGFTLRLNSTVYDLLNEYAVSSGVAVSNIIKLKVYTYIDAEPLEILEPESEQIRINLKLPEEFFEKIKDKANTLDVSINMLINSICFSQLKIHK